MISDRCKLGMPESRRSGLPGNIWTVTTEENSPRSTEPCHGVGCEKQQANTYLDPVDIHSLVLTV